MTYGTFVETIDCHRAMDIIVIVCHLNAADGWLSILASSSYAFGRYLIDTSYTGETASVRCMNDEVSRNLVDGS